ARRAIGDSGEQQALIKTYSRKGFRFIGDVQRNGAEPGEARHEAEASSSIAMDAGTTAALKWGGRPVVAVLPFKNMSDNADQEYFSDGITEDIIAALSKHRSLVVIARNSSFAFKDAVGDVREVGLDLGAEYLVEGSVRKAGDRVRVTAQLVETE